MPNLTVNGTRVYYRESGMNGGQTVLCLHSLFLDGSMFDELSTALNDTCHVLCPDFRGQGQSASANTAIVDMDTLANDLEAFIEALKLKNIFAVAQSMGGDVLIRIAAKRPDLFDSIVLLGTSARAEPPEQLAFVEGFMQAATDSGFHGETLETLMEIMFGESTRLDPDKQDQLTHWREKMAALPRSLAAAMRGVVYRESVVSCLSSITCPVLVISGAEDQVRPGEWADELAHGLANVRHVRLPRVGHSVILEAPSQTIAEIRQFLGE